MHRPNSYPSLPDEVTNFIYEEHGLKSMSEEELLMNLLETGDDWTESEAAMVVDAYNLGQCIHHEDTHREKPYIFHLLRNANRISEYAHVSDAELIVGAILHDAVEDHPEELIAQSGLVIPGDDHANRRLAFGYLRNRFGERVAAMVEGMSNPLPELVEALTYIEKIDRYVAHIAEAIRSMDVFFGKWADWSDNGLGIHYGREDQDPERTEHFMYKYGKVLPVLEARFYDEDIQSMLDPIAKANIERSFALARQRLTVPA